ncbi:MAG TPA: histidine triad nucleotide-binding protein [Papillibacter sp.]|jgi:histidine triad (HIT) family protein|nr:histidine triad nucleotide-binding protein [Papillibacter sp.]
MSDCIFCKIAAGEIPSNKLYEDEFVVAFHDISPQAPVHFLVIPREHIPGAAAVTPDNSRLIARCFEVIAMLAQRENLAGGFRVITNNGQDACQSVHHLHFHVLAGKNLGERLIRD